MLLKTLRLFLYFCCGLYILFTICSKSKGGKGKLKKGKKKGKDLSTNESEGDIKFNINVKPAEQKFDEFDDDEENPLAKIPTKPRLPKTKVPDGTTSRTSSTATNGSKMEAEASFFAPNEKTTGASCYMVKTANKG